MSFYKRQSIDFATPKALAQIAAIELKRINAFNTMCQEPHAKRWDDPRKDKDRPYYPSAGTGAFLIKKGMMLQLHIKRVLYYDAAAVAKRLMAEEMHKGSNERFSQTLKVAEILSHDSDHWNSNELLKKYRHRAYDMLVAYELLKQTAQPAVRRAMERRETDN